ncbi:MAG: O-antigen ligase family protein [Candidatus Andersenbacteria bacterium]
MLTATILAAPLPAFFALGALSVASLGVVRFPAIALGVLMGSLVAGQLVRLPLPGQGGGLLVSDVAVVLVLASALLLRWLRPRKLPLHGNQAVSPSHSLPLISYLLFLPFLAWSLWTLIIHAPDLGSSATLIAGAYWVRLVTYLALLPTLLFLAQFSFYRSCLRTGLLITLSLLVGLGALQLFLVPNLIGFGSGWDPHQNRLVSTWLDPNFFGGLLVLALPWVISLLARPAPQDSVPYNLLLLLGVTGALLVALLLTQSRSAVSALLIAGTLISPLWVIGRSRPKNRVPATMRLLSILGICLALATTSLWLLRDRVWGLVTYDPTVTLRLESVAAVWPLAVAHAGTGVGYNAYQFAAAAAGLLDNFTIHSRAGADNSLLTLWVTTGIIGAALFILPWVAIGLIFVRRWLLYRQPGSLAVAASLLAWMVQAQFINGLLYAHLLIVIIVLIALELTTDPSHESSL